MRSQEDARWLRRRFGHGRCARTQFPWRETQDPYQVLVAELLLQRTRADLVPAAFAAFLDRYPHRPIGGATSRGSRLLRPLGFRTEALGFRGWGVELCARFGGGVPQTEEELMSLPGVGRYVANAVLVVGFGPAGPCSTRTCFGCSSGALGSARNRARPRDDDRLWEFVASNHSLSRSTSRRARADRPRAVVCRPRRPRCAECPLRARCSAFRSGPFGRSGYRITRRSIGFRSQRYSKSRKARLVAECRRRCPRH